MSVDNVTDITPRVQYTALLGQTVFPYPFPIFEDSDLVVDVDGVTKALSTHYAVDGEGEDTGGNVTFLIAPGSGAIVTIYRDIPIERTTDFQTNGPNSSRALNDELDKFIMIQQQLESRLGRTIRLALTNPQPDSELELGGAFAGTYLFINDDGELEPAVAITPTTLTQSVIGALLQPITPREQSAGLTTDDLNRAFAEGELARYKLVGDGVTDEAAAFVKAALVGAQGVKLRGTPGKTYKTISAVTVGNIFDLDLNGAVLKPTGNVQLFTHNRTGTPATASTTVSSGATLGSRSVVVASAAGLAVGYYCIFDSNHADYQSGTWPNNWAKITGIAGTTVEIDVPLGSDYEATVTMHVYNPALFGNLFRVAGTIDLVDSTYATDGATVDISGYKSVDYRDMEVINAASANTGFTAIQILTCLDVQLSGKAVNDNTSANVWDLQSIRSAIVQDLNFDGASFGLNIYRASDVVINGAILNGRRQYEVDEAISATRSIRGIKAIGCLNVNISNVCINGFASPFKFEGNRRVNLCNFTIRNSCPESGDIAVNFGGFGTASKQGGANVSNFTIEGLTGEGAAIGFSNPDIGPAQVSNGYIRRVAAHGIYAESGNYIAVNSVTIEDWSTTGATGVGISAAGGGTFSGITFRNSDNTKFCFQTPASGKTYFYSGIQTPNGNPIFPSSKLFKNKGTATIPSGSTSIVVNHLLVTTPAITDFTLIPGESPTNDPGDVWIDTITATQFTLHCRTNPGASNYDIAWTADLCKNGPFTMP